MSGRVRWAMPRLVQLPPRPPRDRHDPRAVLVVLGFALLVALGSLGTLLLVGRPGVEVHAPAP